MLAQTNLYSYIYLLRLNKPIGILLLLWPTWWALWLASAGHPNPQIVVIFTLGVLVMRSMGCVVNDMADRRFDAFVERTQNRPLATGQISLVQAAFIALFLLSIAFVLVLFCNLLTIKLACVGACLALIYPLLKRVTHLPQLGLGIAFTWGVPMAFAAQTNHVLYSAWFLFLTGTIWPVIYDTLYAMVDREDDKRIGVKSTAILFNDFDKIIIAGLQVLFLLMLSIIGIMFHLHWIYFISLLLVASLFIYQQWLIRKSERHNCFKAFLNNNWVGCIIFSGIFLSYVL